MLTRVFEAKFKYCPFTYMFYSRSTNRRRNHLHKTALKLIYDDYELTFEELLEADGSFGIHHFHIQILCNKLTKVYHNLSKAMLRNSIIQKIYRLPRNLLEFIYLFGGTKLHILPR